MPIASSLLNKPRLVKKLKDFYSYVQKNDGKVGTKTRGIDLNFNNACNLRCKYCFTNSPKGDHVKEYLDIGAIKRLADEPELTISEYLVLIFFVNFLSNSKVFLPIVIKVLFKTEIPAFISSES